jgi:hypothetical protein
MPNREGGGRIGKVGCQGASAALLVSLILVSTLAGLQPNLLSKVYAQDVGSITPARQWGVFFDTNGDLQLTVDESGIAVRVELPREFTIGVVSGENDTSFIESDINNDYYYYAVWDEANHYAYKPDGPCFKPNASQYDSNAPICVEIWSTFNNTLVNFTAPRFIRFRELRAPSLAGLYNVTMYIAKTTNVLGYPDFVNAVNQTFRIPVSERESPGRIYGYIRDGETDEIIKAKGVVYALDVDQNNIVARAFVNSTTGFYNVTGLFAGTYILQASAGVFTRADGMLLAYSLTEWPFPITIGPGQTVSLDIYLDRAPQIFGSIIYRNSTAFPFQIRAITDNAWFQIVGVTVLNYTVEARDSLGNIYRNSSISKDRIEGDTFRIIIGNGTKFVGYPSYGTEFAGLPRTSIAGGAETYTMNAWIYGYLQASTTPPTVTIDGRIQHEKRVDFIMNMGGLIAGRIRFFNPNTNLPESPRDAEISILGTSADKLFGGNVLIQVLDESGRLRGVTVYNRTLPDGAVTYATDAEIPFYVLGFSEFYNRTYSGIWRSKDYGLGTPGTTSEIFRLQVFIRGYYESEQVQASLATGGMRNVTYDMLRGPLIEVGVYSYNTRSGTRVLQAQKPWILLGAMIPPRLRLYFYDEEDVSLGYVEKILALGVENVTQTSLIVRFTGMNWATRDIVYFGFIPTVIPEEMISIKAYTVGYVQQMDVGVFAAAGVAVETQMALIIANLLNALVPLFGDAFLLTSLTEFAFPRLELYDQDNVLWGVNTLNATAGTSTLNFTVLGFGGLPHFFYVDPEGNRFYDYGIEAGDYSATLPDFGFTWRRVFTQYAAPPPFSFPRLQYQIGIMFDAYRLGLVYPGVGLLVRGFNSTFPFGNRLVELSWVLVEASNTVIRHTSTMDGNYTLHLPAGTYTLRFSLPGYTTKEYVAIVIVDWSDIIAWDPTPLEQSGAPFPVSPSGQMLDVEVIPISDQGNSTSGYLLTAQIDGDQNDVIFRWSVSEGSLNQTEGGVVLWIPPADPSSDGYEIICRAYRNSDLVAEQTVTVTIQSIPEFPVATAASLVLVFAFVLFFLATRRSKTLFPFSARPTSGRQQMSVLTRYS